MKYEVSADVYEGPLPLLVELAKLNLIDVFLIKLVALTQQYFETIARSERDLNELAEPLPLLGLLVAIKARGLMPQPKAPDEEDEAPVSLEELDRRIKEYEQFKSVAQILAELHQLAHQHFGRGRSEIPDAPRPEPAGFADVGIIDLVSAFSKVLERATAPVYEMNVEPWTVEMKVKDLRVLLTVKRQVRFFDLFTSTKSRLERVVTFLALLELIRQRFARAVQERPFDDIMVAYVGETVPAVDGNAVAQSAGA